MGSTVARWLRRPGREAQLLTRELTWRRRAAPDFIIIGAQKSGTTSLFHYLEQHPMLFGSFAKEVHFFDGGLSPDIDAFAKGQRWYRSNFPLRSAMPAGGLAFEASPLYLFNPLVPARIADAYPNVKLLAILRDPTERAISHHRHSQRKGKEPLELKPALDAEEARLAPALASQDYKHPSYIRHSYRRRGQYLQQLQNYTEHFDRNALLLLSSERFFSDPLGTLRQTFRFLGVDEDVDIPDLRPRNVAPESAQVDPATVAELRAYFAPQNEALRKTFGVDFDWPEA